MKGIEFNAYDAPIEVNDNGSVTGYVVVWGVIDNKKDIHYPEAYKKTASENRYIPLLPNHDQDTPIGSVTSLEIDGFGLKFTAELASTDRAQEYRTLLQEGVIKKFSMGWTALRSKRRADGGRDILEVKLFEISPVAVPVGEETMVLEVNNINVDESPDVIDRFYGLAKNIGDRKLKSQNQAEVLKLAKLYEDATQPSEDTEPEVVIPTKEEQDAKLNEELNEALINYLNK